MAKSFSGSLKAQLIRGAGATFSVRFLAVMAGLMSSVVLARVLGPSHYGVYAYILAISSLLSMPIKLGLPTLVVRETALAQKDADGPRLKGIWIWAVSYATIGSLLIAIIILAVLPIWPQILDPTAKQTLLWTIPLMLLMALGNLVTAALRGLRKMFEGPFADKVLRPIFLVSLVLFAALYLSMKVTSADVMMLHSISCLAILIFVVLFLWRVRPVELLATTGFTFKHKAWLASIIPLSLIAGLQIISRNTDLVMLGLFVEEEYVGIYRVVLNCASLVTFGSTAISMVVQPYFARLYAESNIGQLQSVATIASRAGVAMTLPALLVLCFFGREIIVVLFGSAYEQGALALIILVVAQFVNAFFGAAGALLAMSKNEAAAARGLIYSTISNVALNAIFIPLYGIEGAAFATGISIIIWNVYFWRSTWNRLNLDSSALGLKSFKPS